MGLKSHSYRVEEFGLTIPLAYAKITDIVIDAHGNASATFAIQQSRDKVDTTAPLEEKRLDCVINKDLPIYEQIYNISKIMMFKNWEDDIVVDVVEELTPEYAEPTIKEEEKESEIGEGGQDEVKSEVE